MLLKAFVLFLFLAAGFFCASSSAQMTRVRRENMKVEINATEDTIVLKFIRPRAGTRLEGYILGYGGSMFSKQYIQLPQDGKTYHGEMDAEPKYLISVVPARGNDVKEECRDKVDLQKPLHLVIGSVTPTSVMLSWGTLLKTPFANADEEDCPDHELYTVRYREQEEERKWNYQSCPTSTTVVDHLKPNTPYEFGVRAHSEEGEGAWTPPVVHNTNTEFEKSFRPPVKPIMALPKNEEIFSARPGQRDRHMPPRLPVSTQTQRSRPNNHAMPAPGRRVMSPPRNTTVRRPDSNGEMKMAVTRTKPRPLVPNGPPKWRPRPKETNQVPVPETKRNKGPVSPWKQVDPEPVPKPTVPAPPVKTTSAPTPTMPVYFNGSRFEAGDNSSVFRPVPVSEVDAMGKKRFTAPHVVYITDKRPEEPCSVTQSLSLFPNEEPTDVNITGPPRTPPSNVTVVTVEGCSSFVIIDWEKSDNETTEYEVISKATTGQNGDPEVSVQTTNQTHTAVENLKPESSYEFTVKPKNELGSGPASEPVTFSTESADPRVTEERTGKDAIWSTFPFKMDLDAECNGRQYVKRTWYRKFVGIQLCNSLRYKIYLSDSLRGPFYHIGDQVGNGEDHCQFVDSFLDGRTGSAVPSDHLPATQGFFRAVRQEPVYFGEIGGNTRINYVSWYECGVSIPGKW
ncbi:target of Nesh-SH3 isoform X4 [Denticeps clupeoides]|uniref:target of Nesh-SH3 isoform X4 n=1 Tax=Denticeps clupeoides TaxID=299321 RepID=UPI0010A550BF|nr:target of Nesh-SH3-like isoform X4 [Denticeps clupeoides]